MAEKQLIGNIKGIKGDKGDPGEKGEKGDKGDSYEIQPSDYDAIAGKVDIVLGFNGTSITKDGQPISNAEVIAYANEKKMVVIRYNDSIYYLVYDKSTGTQEAQFLAFDMYFKSGRQHYAFYDIRVTATAIETGSFNLKNKLDIMQNSIWEAGEWVNHINYELDDSNEPGIKTIMVGDGLWASREGEVILGRYNGSKALNDEDIYDYISSEPVFEIGVGSDADHRNDGVYVGEHGEVYATQLFTLSDPNRGATIIDVAEEISTAKTKNASQDAEIVALKETLTEQEKINKAQQREIENLKSAVEGQLYRAEVDDEVAYSKVIPSGVMPYGEMANVGGKSITTTNLIPFEILPNTATINGVTFTNNNDGTVSVKGTATGGNASYVLPNISVTAGTYRISCPEFTDGATVYCTALLNGSWSKSYINRSFTVEQDGYVQILIAVNNGQTIDKIARPMLTKGADIVPFEKGFTGIKNATIAERVVVGKNLWNEDVVRTHIFKNNSGEDASDPNRYFKRNEILVRPNTTYYLGFSSRNSGACRLSEYNGDSFIKRTIYEQNVSFTTTATTTKIIVDNDTEPYYFTDFYINENVNGGYAPYSKQTQDFTTLANKYFPNGMKSAGNVYDELDLEKGKAIQRVGVLDKNSDWVLGSDSVNAYGIGYLMFNMPKPLPINIPTTSNIIYNERIFAESTEMEIFSNTTNIFFRFPSNNPVTLAKGKEALANANCIIYYELAEPIVTDITEDITDYINLDNLEPNGTITLKTALDDESMQVAIPSTMNYLVKVV